MENIIKLKKEKSSWNKGVYGEEYLKHFKNNKIWHTGLTKKEHPSLLIISQKQSKENNPMWRGDDVSYISLHNWIRRHKSKPELCEDCKEEEPYDLANISGEYKRDINDYKWVCRRCHMKGDGRMNNLKKGGTYNFGSKNGQAKLNEEQVREIKLLLLKKIFHKEIAKKFNVEKNTIGNINVGKTWSHVKIDQKEVYNGI